MRGGVGGRRRLAASQQRRWQRQWRLRLLRRRRREARALPRLLRWGGGEGVGRRGRRGDGRGGGGVRGVDESWIRATVFGGEGREVNETEKGRFMRPRSLLLNVSLYVKYQV